MLQSLSVLLGRPEIWLGALGLAVFLAFFWVLRGSLPGQFAQPREEDPAMPGRLRDLMIATVALGLVLILLGACLAFMRGILVSIPPFVAGVVLVLTFSAVARRRRHVSPVLRRTSEYSDLFLNAALIGGILTIANVAAFRYGGRGIDLTRERTFSLSSLTLNQIESLKRPLTFHLVYGGGARAVRQLDRVYQLLELYRAASSGRIKVENLNPYTELSRAEDLARRAPDLAVLRGGGVLIEYGEGKDAEFAVVSSQEMFEPVSPEASRADVDRFASNFKGEDAITSALIRFGEGKKSKVVFTTGHGEPAPSDVNPSSQGVGLWRARLNSVGCEVSEINLIGGSVPDDVSLVIIAGPKTPFKPEELARLKIYADRGGPVLALIGNTDPTGLDEFLKSFNLEIGRGLVIDPRLNFNRNVQLIFAVLRGSQGHPITDALQSERAVLVPNGAPIHILGQAGRGQSVPPVSNTNLVPIAILRSSPQSWAETDLGNPRPKLDHGDDEPGPVIVGVAIQERAPGGAAAASAGSVASPRPRLVLFSSAAIADNVVQGIEPTNLDLVMNATSWLRGRPDAVGIAPNTHMALTLTADPLLRSRLVLVPTVMAVLAILATGTVVYVSRRE